MLDKEQNQRNIQEEITHLQKKIEEKKKEMKEAGIEASAEKAESAEKEGLKEYEKKEMSEIDLEKIKKTAEILKLKPEEHDPQVEKLMEIAREKGPLFALKVAYRLNNPHLQDDF